MDFEQFEWLLEVSSKTSPSPDEIGQYREKVNQYLQLLSSFGNDSAFKNYEHILSDHACDVLEVQVIHSI
jgi:hypothetical protein